MTRRALESRLSVIGFYFKYHLPTKSLFLSQFNVGSGTKDGNILKPNIDVRRIY